MLSGEPEGPVDQDFEGEAAVGAGAQGAVEFVERVPAHLDERVGGDGLDIFGALGVLLEAEEQGAGEQQDNVRAEAKADGLSDEVVEREGLPGAWGA